MTNIFNVYGKKVIISPDWEYVYYKNRKLKNSLKSRFTVMGYFNQAVACTYGLNPPKEMPTLPPRPTWDWCSRALRWMAHEAQHDNYMASQRLHNYADSARADCFISAAGLRQNMRRYKTEVVPEDGIYELFRHISNPTHSAQAIEYERNQ